MKQLPAEITDMIIDFVGESTIPLLWHRSLQFKTLDFARYHSQDHLDQFFDIISSTHATITSHVLRIALDVSGSHLSPDQLERFVSLQALHTIILVGECLDGDPVMADDIPVDTIVTVLESLSKVVILELLRIPFDYFEPLQNIVTACPNLEKLFMKGIEDLSFSDMDSERHRPINTPPEPLPCASLQLLSSVDCPFNTPFFRWVRKSCSRWQSNQLQSICMDFESLFVDRKKFHHLIHDLGATLKNLCIVNMKNYLTNRRFSPRPNLKYCTHLEVLSFSHCDKETLEFTNGLAMINKVASDRFRFLNISFVDEDGDLGDILASHHAHLTAIDNHLQQTNFINFQCLTLGVPDNSINTIQDYFPLTAARGLHLKMYVWRWLQ
ncbi:hypothetical protein FIBSPDRAFT_898222 [Athelia psychrophila]|uniref:F-box domain-containing protein n=1 Tax=Athelia psychrophila TaxID=1759441 RepID=A0A166BBF2_9AGAM|nr:hypothetical protein FIBSPDRAFT_898222 [Fibularhizoctonia sp. CBS 109695]